MTENRNAGTCRLTGWIMARELRENAVEYLRGILYYLPVLLICLVLISAGVVRYDNQRAFLNRMTYAGILISDTADVDGTADFQVFQAAAAAGEERRDLLLYKYQYQAQIFRPLRKGIDYAGTYFAGTSASDLKADEAAVSYDTARALHLSTGDELLLTSADGGSYISVYIKEMFQTKYAYENIGEVGTILLGYDAEEAESPQAAEEEWTDFFGESQYFTFLQEAAAGQISNGKLLWRQEELAETDLIRALAAAGMTEWRSPSMLFPLLGLLLLLRIASRELSRRFKEREPVMAVWMAQGCPDRVWKRIFLLTEELLLSLSSLLALLLYKFAFLQGLAGEYLRWPLLAAAWVLLTVGALPLLLFVRHRQKAKWKALDLAGLLTGNTDVQPKKERT